MHVLPNAMVGVRGHAFVEIGGFQIHHDFEHALPLSKPKSCALVTELAVIRNLPSATSALTMASLQWGVFFSMPNVNLVG
jgi:hypothetical protein